ncbi:MAG: hypothetical protein R3E96_08305 [Planctomycetota bacterium]
MRIPPQHAGTYHVATGTWTRNVPQAIAPGPDVVYNNSANVELYTTMGIATQAPGESIQFVHNGRIPSLSATGAGANRDTYNVNGIDIGYCLTDDSAATGALSAKITLYDGYDPCTDPATAMRVAGGFLATGLPGALIFNTIHGYATCWTVHLDLSGGGEVCLAGDGDTVFDGDTAFDSFGFGIEFDPAGVGATSVPYPVGPMLAGDRDFTVQGPGEITPASLLGGGGGGGILRPGSLHSSCRGTELIRDSIPKIQFWLGYGPSSTNNSGCYWFRGYAGGMACGVPGTIAQPQASNYSVLYADTSACTTQ